MQIEVSGLHKSFLDGEGHQLHILKGLDFKLEAGASAAADLLKQHGFKAYANSRLD